MTTMFDAPMHDFTGDNTMDADMLPSSTSDSDWLQVENMMEDADAPRPLTEEVDMIHGDVQEFEMRDAGETYFPEDTDRISSEVAQHVHTEPQDQEIPDASRAPSPSALVAFSRPDLLPASVGSEDFPQEFRSEQACSREATDNVPLDSTTSQRDEGHESSIQLPESSKEDIPTPSVVVCGTSVGAHGTSASLEERALPAYPHTQAPIIEPLEHGGAPERSSVHDLASHTETSQEEHPLPEVEEDGGPAIDPPVPLSEAHVEGQVAQEEEEGPLIDPPPSVLLSYPFDGSHFSLFNLPEELQHDFIVTGAEIPSSSQVDVTRESDAKDGSSRAENHSVSEAPILLFRERFALYYEPFSRVFEALRGDEAINKGGRFDHNIELVISAPELDLTLPEDNVNAREVSLHDLGVLHTGCDLSGPLSLRLDTISPRFGTRYKAIRDEIVRVVSQQEEDEQRSELESTEVLRADGVLKHELPDTQTPQEAPEDFSSVQNRPSVVKDDSESHEQSSESKAGVGENDTHEHKPGPYHVEADVEAEDADAEGYEDEGSGEYVEYVEYVDPSGDAAVGESYEDAEGEYVDEDEDGVEEDYNDDEEPYSVEDGREEQVGGRPDNPDRATHPYPVEAEQNRSPALQDANDSETTGEFFENVQEYTVQSGDNGPSAGDVSEEHESTASTAFVPVEESIEAHVPPSVIVPDQLTDTTELDNSVHEVTSHDFLLSAEPFSDTEHLLSDVRPRSRSDTSNLSTNGKHGQDEVIAYEDTVEDNHEPERVSKEPTLPTNPGVHGSRVLSTASKRSYDEHESDQFESVESQHSASGEAKRLRVD